MTPVPASPSTARVDQTIRRDFAFALGSCKYPGGILDRSITPSRGRFDTGLSDRSWQRLSMESQPKPELFVVAGDQVYIDATAGLFDAKTMNDGGRNAYEALEKMPSFRPLNTAMQRRVMLDDHEIRDNWEPVPGGPAAGHLRDVLVDGCRWYIRKGRPDPVLDHYYAGDQLWFEFVQAGHQFFMADTRTQRQGRNAANIFDARIMDDEQWRNLVNRIRTSPRDRPLFVVSPSMFLPRMLGSARNDAAALFSQGWDGYPASQRDMLACLVEDRRDNVVFLSGDAHLSLATRFVASRCDDPRHTARGYSIHGSALYAPYPFANAVEADFANCEGFAFESAFSGNPVRYECYVQSNFGRVGDNYALLTTAAVDASWTLAVTFVGEKIRRTVPLTY